jgi:hypothetical protein
MGVNSGFLAVAGLDETEVLRRLGRRLGDVVDEPDTRDDDRMPALGPVVDGWTIIVDQPLHLLLDEPAVSRLGRGTTLVTLVLSETVMESDARGYVDGQERWSVTSGGDRDRRRAWPRLRVRWWRRLLSPPGPSRLQVTGDPPGDLPALLDAALRREAADPGWQGMKVDYQYEIPSEVVAAATGGAFTGWPLDDGWVFRELLPA